MKFKIGDREYEFDGDFTIEEAMWFYDKANIGVAELQQALIRGNPYVSATYMFILKKRAGEAVRWQDMQAYSVADFSVVPDDPDGDLDNPQQGGEAPDPTRDGGTTPEPDTTTT